MKLARKIILVLLSTYLVLVGVVSYFETRRAISGREERVQSELLGVARTLRPALLEVWQVEGEARALEVLERANRDDRVLTLRFHALTPLDAVTSPHASELRQGQVVSFIEGTGAAERMVVLLPTARGAVELSRPLAPEHVAVRREVERRVLSASAVVLVASIVSVVAGLWLVGGPMRSVIELARRIGAGDLTKRLHLRPRDEIGELAEQMNQMCDRLLEANRRIAEEGEARVHAIEELRHADRLRTVGALASGMAHELGTPLSIVAGRAKMIATGEYAKEDDQRYARIIQNQAERMTKIMRDLLDFARRKTALRVPGDLNDVVRRTVELLMPLARKSQVSLRIESAADDKAEAFVDPGQVEQALANIVVNGIHASREEGEVEIAVQPVHATRPSELGGGEVDCQRIAVRDHGRGIAPADMSRIFEPFFTTKGVGEGTGLGLSVAHGIVADHGGWIDVRSEAGEGTTFQLYFPRDRDASAHAARTP